MSCLTCKHYEPHALYPYVGYCKEEKSVVLDREGCERRSNLDYASLKGGVVEAGWVYCITCREPIYSLEDLDRHFSGGHAVVSGFMDDQVSLEESHAAD